MYKHAHGQNTPSAGPNHPKSLDRIGMPRLPRSAPPKPFVPIINQAKFSFAQRRRRKATRAKDAAQFNAQES